MLRVCIARITLSIVKGLVHVLWFCFPSSLRLRVPVNFDKSYVKALQQQLVAWDIPVFQGVGLAPSLHVPSS